MLRVTFGIIVFATGKVLGGMKQFEADEGREKTEPARDSKSNLSESFG
jgi:hypothetical protein